MNITFALLESLRSETSLERLDFPRLPYIYIYIYIFLRFIETEYYLFCDIIATKILSRPKHGRDNVSATFIFQPLKLLLLKERQWFEVFIAEVLFLDLLLFSCYFKIKFRLCISVTYENTDIIVTYNIFHHTASEERICLLSP